MKNGKISENVLKRSVMKQLHSKNDAVLQAAAPGADYAAIDAAFAASSGSPADEKNSSAPVLVTASACETLETADMAKRCMVRALNNLAVSGAAACACQAVLILPTLSNEAQLREMMRDVNRVCEKHGVQVTGGHTTVTRAVKKPLLAITALGFCTADKRIPSGGAKPGMDIIMTKYIGLEGTALLASERADDLLKRFSQPFLDRAAAYSEWMEIVQEAAVAAQAGAAAMHDVSEGGIFGALWEMAEASGIGLEIDLKKIPIRQETVEISEFFDLNPYKLLSGGALLIAAADGSGIVRELEKAGIPAAIIGKATDSNDRVLLQQEERRFLETVQTDEIYKVFED